MLRPAAPSLRPMPPASTPVPRAGALGALAVTAMVALVPATAFATRSQSTTPVPLATWAATFCTSFAPYETAALAAQTADAARLRQRGGPHARARQPGPRSVRRSRPPVPTAQAAATAATRRPGSRTANGEQARRGDLADARRHGRGVREGGRRSRRRSRPSPRRCAPRSRRPPSSSPPRSTPTPTTPSDSGSSTRATRSPRRSRPIPRARRRNPATSTTPPVATIPPAP